MKALLKKWFPHETRVQLCAAFLGGFAVPLLYRSLRVTQENADRVDQMVTEHGGVIYVTWHGRCLMPLAKMRGRGFYALVSRSGDGDLMAATFARMGWKLIRGSSGRRGVEAIRTGLKALAEPGMRLAFTPDGPRGPACIAKAGVTYWAQKSGKPIIPTGVSAKPRKILRSWDAFLLPHPFARAHFEYGEPIFVGPNDDLEAATLEVQNAINAMQERAEQKLGIIVSTKEISVPAVMPIV